MGILVALPMMSATITEKSLVTDYKKIEITNAEYTTEHIGGVKYKFSTNNGITIIGRVRSDFYCKLYDAEVGELERTWWEVVWDWITFKPNANEYLGVRQCNVPFEIVSADGKVETIRDIKVSTERIDKYGYKVYYSYEFDETIKENDKSVYADIEKESLLLEKKESILVREFKNFKPIEEIQDLDLTKPVAVMVSFNMPYTASANYNILVEGKEISTRLDPAVGITNCSEFQSINDDCTADYYLGNNIDCSETYTWLNNGVGSGFNGTCAVTAYSGNFDGRNYTISDIYINRSSSTIYNYCPFAKLSQNISNVIFSNVNITGNYFTAGVVCNIQDTARANINRVGVDGGTIYNPASGNGGTGGLVGRLGGGLINNSYVNGIKVESKSDSGMIGGMVGTGNQGRIQNSFSSANVTGNEEVGGIVGRGGNVNLTNVFSAGNITWDGAGQFGGILGALDTATIVNCYWMNWTDNARECYSGGNTGCTAKTDLSWFQGQLTNAPMSSWSSTIWKAEVGSFPLFLFEAFASWRIILNSPVSGTYPDNNLSINCSRFPYFEVFYSKWKLCFFISTVFVVYSFSD